MHGSVCLFSRYLKNLLEGENLDELDISSASSSDNIYTNLKTLSTGWKGTCPLVNQYNDLYNMYNTYVNSINDIIKEKHANIMQYYTNINKYLDDMTKASNINSNRPSGSTESIMSKSEIEFSDKKNKSLISGKIYTDYTEYLKPNIETLNDTIGKGLNDFFNYCGFGNLIHDAYENFANFDTTVATASNIMNNRILDLKDYFLSIQFVLMFFTWAYLFFFVCIIMVYIIYMWKNYNILWYFLIVLVNILLVMMLVEIFIASFFGQLRLICHEVPRAMNFIFNGEYMLSGNSASYPAKFGTGNANMTKMFSTCLNGDGDLVKLFLSSIDLLAFNIVKGIIDKIYLNITEVVDKSNLITNNYDNVLNSMLLQGIIKLETMSDNLYLATEGFGNDDIYYILNKIRSNLDLSNCSMTEEYYVIRSSECPSGSTELTTIYNTTGSLHCYVIQNLETTTSASYANSECDNDYINTAIKFIQEINNSIKKRIEELKLFQIVYSEEYSTLLVELESLSSTFNLTYDLLNSNLSNSSIANCGSTKFDLIDFSDFIGETTEYDAQIVLIFASFVGVFGYVMLYSFLNVLNSFEVSGGDNDFDDYGYHYNYGKKNNKIRNININVNNARPIKRNSNYYDQDEEEEDDDYNNKNNKLKKGKAPPKTTQNVEMSYLSKNNEDSDSS